MAQNSNDYPADDCGPHERRSMNRRQDYERRGVLRWDPVMKERRREKDRRDLSIRLSQRHYIVHTRQ